MNLTRTSAAVALALTLVVAACGGSDSNSNPSGGGEPDADDLDLSVDLDEIDANIAAEQETLDNVDLSQGFQCPIVDNQIVDDMTSRQVARVVEGADGCIFYFDRFESDPMVIDAYTKDNLIAEAQGSADLLIASTGGRAVEVPNALAAYVYEDGFTPDNLPELVDGALGPGRQVVGYFMGTRGVRIVAAFPDAIVGVYDGSDTGLDEPERIQLFIDLMALSTSASG